MAMALFPFIGEPFEKFSINVRSTKYNLSFSMTLTRVLFPFDFYFVKGTTQFTFRSTSITQSIRGYRFILTLGTDCIIYTRKFGTFFSFIC